MTFSYINSLFLKSIGLICPVEIERHIIGDITSQKLFKKVNELLNLSPTMKEIEEWSLEAKSMKKTELTKLLQKTMRDKFPPYHGIAMPKNSSLRGKQNSLFKVGLDCEYVNIKLFCYCNNAFKRLKCDMVFGKFFRKDKRWIEVKPCDHSQYEKINQYYKNEGSNEVEFSDTLKAIQETKISMDTDESIFKNKRNNGRIFHTRIPGVLTSLQRRNILMETWSRHPIISKTAKNKGRCATYKLNKEVDELTVGDMVKSCMVKDNYEYEFKQGWWVYYIQNDGGTLRRR